MAEKLKLEKGVHYGEDLHCENFLSTNNLCVETMWDGPEFRFKGLKKYDEEIGYDEENSYQSFSITTNTDLSNVPLKTLKEIIESVRGIIEVDDEGNYHYAEKSPITTYLKHEIKARVGT